MSRHLHNDKLTGLRRTSKLAICNAVTEIVRLYETLNNKNNAKDPVEETQNPTEN